MLSTLLRPSDALGCLLLLRLRRCQRMLLLMLPVVLRVPGAASSSELEQLYSKNMSCSTHGVKLDVKDTVDGVGLHGREAPDATLGDKRGSWGSIGTCASHSMTDSTAQHGTCCLHNAACIMLLAQCCLRNAACAMLLAQCCLRKAASATSIQSHHTRPPNVPFTAGGAAAGAGG
jgi:hypothetical protein